MQSVIFSVSQQHVVRVLGTHWQNLRMLCQSLFITALRISIFQSLLFENEAYNIFLAFLYLCSWKFLSFSYDLTLPIVGSTFQLTGRHDPIGSPRSVEIFAASQAVRLPAVKIKNPLGSRDSFIPHFRVQSNIVWSRLSRV